MESGELRCPTDSNRKVLAFYRDEDQKIIEDFSRRMEVKYSVRIRDFYWDEKRGLTGISVNGGRLNLSDSENKYALQKIPKKSLLGKALSEIAEQYLKILNKE